MANKGSPFEREICKKLSLWWTNGEDDDVFWRSEGSGGRAKRRGRAGKDTYGAHGDLRVTNPIGTPLIQLLCIECKRGYSKSGLQDVIDGCKLPGQSTFDDWFQQTRESWKQSGSYSWAILHRRDKREALISIPSKLYKDFIDAGCFEELPIPRMTLVTRFKLKIEKMKGKKKRTVTKLIKCTVETMRLDDFLECVTPKIIKKLVARKEEV